MTPILVLNVQGALTKCPLLELPTSQKDTNVCVGCEYIILITRDKRYKPTLIFVSAISLVVGDLLNCKIQHLNLFIQHEYLYR